MRIITCGITVLTIVFYIVVVFDSASCKTATEIENESEVESGTCDGDTCQIDKDINDEKVKYYLDKAQKYHAEHSDPGDEMTDEDLKNILIGFRDKTIDIKKIPDDTIDRSEEEVLVEKETAEEEQEGNVEEQEEDVESFEFPRLTMIDPGNVGDVKEVELEEGIKYRMITRSVRPPVFEIPNFLTNEECNMIIGSAVESGLNVSKVFGSDIEEEFDEEEDLSEISRVSEQTWLREYNLGSEFWEKLFARVAKLTGLPIGMVLRGEPIQVVSYAPGGHYHAHLDTVDEVDHLPCCFQTKCGDKEHTPEWAECCRLCRFITVLYYLNEPEEGGETAFPLADMPEELVEEKFVNVEEQDWYNLSHYCHNSSLVVKPKRGTAIMWYSHFIDEETGYLGKVDRMSHHGGCDLKKGTKWIANNWISGTTYGDRFKPSVFY